MKFSRQEYWSDCHALLQGIFSTQVSNPGLLHCRWILLLSEPPGKPKNTVAGGLSLLQGNFPTRDGTRVYCIAGRFFTSWATREAPFPCICVIKIVLFSPVNLSCVNLSLRSASKTRKGRENFFLISKWMLCGILFKDMKEIMIRTKNRNKIITYSSEEWNWVTGVGWGGGWREALTTVS